MGVARFETIAAVVDHAAHFQGHQEGLIDGGNRWSFAELVTKAHEAARALMASGVARGDRVAIWAPNTSEWVTVALGAHAVGVVVVPINTRFKGGEVADILRRTRAKMMFLVTDFLDTDYVGALERMGKAETLSEIVVLRGSCPPKTTSFDSFMERSSMVADTERALRSENIAGTDPCHILFTSGTTGEAKGVMLNHAAVCRSYRSWATQVGLDRDRYLLANPLFHTLGLHAGLLSCLMTGSTMVMQQVFDPSAVLERIDAENLTVVCGPPAMFQTLLNADNLHAHDLSSLRLAVIGGAVISPELIAQMFNRLGFEKIVTGYGLAEASGVVTTCHHNDDRKIIAQTSGRALKDIEVQVVDKTGKPVPTGESGEVWVRGYNITDGYLDDPDCTAEIIDSDGFLHTGDIGSMDAEGNLAITGRLGDMFIVGGFNVHPTEVERTIATHPGVAQVAVIGVSDQRLGEVGYAFVVSKEGYAPDHEGLLSWCRQELANYKVPRYVKFVANLPTNANGKVLKHQLRHLLI